MGKKKKEERRERIDHYEEGKGGVVLKDGNEEGLVAIVRVAEEVNVEQDHDSNIKSVSFSGKLNVENPSETDRLWDLDITLKNVESTDLGAENIQIQELGVTEDDNVESREFQLSGDVQNLLLIKEYINTLPDATNILNRNDVENDLLTLKSTEEEPEEDTDEDSDGAAEEYSLESYGISINKLNSPVFVIAAHSLFDNPITEVTVTKTIPDEFETIKVRDTTIGDARVDGNQVIWTIDELDPELTAILRISTEITVGSNESVKTGPIEVAYKASSSFTGGLEIENFEGWTNNKHYIDIIERDEEPNMWDCNLVFENPSEFKIRLLSTDAHDADELDTNFIALEEDYTPLLPAGAQWHSVGWEYESEDYPAFRKKIDFTVLAELEAEVSGTITIDEIELILASITGELEYIEPDIVDIPEEDRPENVILVPSYKDSEVENVMKIINDGSGPLNEVRIEQKGFTENFKPPEPDEIELIWDGEKVPLEPEKIKITPDSVEITLDDLKDHPKGMFEPESVIEVKYPIHSDNPPKDIVFSPDVAYYANTYPPSQELEYIPEADIPTIQVYHIRRKYQVGKEIIPVGALGNYEIKLHYTNRGEMPLRDFTLIDKVPDNFEYSDFSSEPEITDEVGTDTLKWEIELLEKGDTLEITYSISGTGEYRPSDAQLAF